MANRESTADPGGRSSAAVIVAHPDDETLWAGGAILSRPRWSWFVATLCRASDADRAPKFARVLECLGAQGAMADLDDGPEQAPLPEQDVQETIVSLLPEGRFDVVLTHGPEGEYTRHLRHEEVCRAVVSLWASQRLAAGSLWMFAFEDGNRQYLPRPRGDADRLETISEDVWHEKYRLMTEVYGFGPDTWEARTTPHTEAFRCFDSPRTALERIHHRGS